MSTDCPSKGWDRYVSNEEEAADIAEAIEAKVLEEVQKIEGHPELDRSDTVATRAMVSDIIRVAFNKGYEQANKDRRDAEDQYAHETEERRLLKLWKVVPYMRIEEEDKERRSYADCEREIDHLEMMNDGENLYVIEEV
tara:strand:- start:489 stop:905 length:417 start_codon:yes stop_codon:yes gene_type:complete